MLAEKFIEEYSIDSSTSLQGTNISNIIKNYDAYS